MAKIILYFKDEIKIYFGFKGKIMEYFFVYILKENEEILRIGKGYCYSKTASDVTNYINNRPAYKDIPGDDIEFYWCASESAALSKEEKFLDDYFEKLGEFPPYNGFVA